MRENPFGPSFQNPLTNHAKDCLILELPVSYGISGGDDLYKTVAYDKGKPAVRQGRKAVSLFCLESERFWRDCLVAEGNWKESKTSDFPLLDSGKESNRTAANILTHPAAF
jgi:hypothetical protein